MVTLDLSFRVCAGDLTRCGIREMTTCSKACSKSFKLVKDITQSDWVCEGSRSISASFLQLSIDASSKVSNMQQNSLIRHRGKLGKPINDFVFEKSHFWHFGVYYVFT